MFDTLDELAVYVRESIPEPRAITNLQVKPDADVVTFFWQGRNFLIRRSLQTFEMKGSNLFITGASTLLQVVLLKREKRRRVLEAAADLIRQADDLITIKHQRDAGLRLLDAAKSTLIKLSKT